MASSESRFGISEQPGNTCPDIDGLLDSIKNIGELDEDYEIIEVEPDYGSIQSAQANVEDIKSWQEDWLDLTQKTIDRIDDILIAIDEINQDDQSDLDITFEKEAYYHYFQNDYDDLKNTKESLEETYEDWQKSIKSDFWDTERAYSDISVSIDNNDENSNSVIESYRSIVTDFRANGNYYKEQIKDMAETLLPEEVNELSFEEQYDEHLDKIEQEKEIKEALNLLKTKEEPQKNKKRHKLNI